MHRATFKYWPERVWLSNVHCYWRLRVWCKYYKTHMQYNFDDCHIISTHSVHFRKIDGRSVSVRGSALWDCCCCCHCCSHGCCGCCFGVREPTLRSASRLWQRQAAKCDQLFQENCVGYMRSVVLQSPAMLAVVQLLSSLSTIIAAFILLFSTIILLCSCRQQ
jgi:hypothetical protein